MKINGTDIIAKLLLEIKSDEGGMKKLIGPDNLEKITQKVDEVIPKDEFLQSGKVNNVKSEVQFTKNLSESPEAYLQRISAEVINQRESDKATPGNSEHSDITNKNALVETAARTGLLKESMFLRNDKINRFIGDFNVKWLSKVIAVFLLVLLIFFLLK